VRLAAERGRAVSAVAGAHGDSDLVEEHQLNPSPGRGADRLPSARIRPRRRRRSWSGWPGTPH
jgi:hypothetical protein